MKRITAIIISAVLVVAVGALIFVGPMLVGDTKAENIFSVSGTEMPKMLCGSVLSEGNLWIILGMAILACVAVAGLIVFVKRKKK